MISVPVAGYIILHDDDVQTYLTQKITRSLSDKLDAEFRIKEVDFRPFNKLVLRDVLIKDQMKDTLLSAEELVIGIISISSGKKTVNLSRIVIDKADVQFRNDSSNAINIKFITDKFKRKDTTKQRWKVFFNRIELSDSKFRYEISNDSAKNKSLDEIQLKDLNVKLKKFRVIEGTASFTIDNINCDITNHLTLKNLNTDFTVNKQLMKLENLYLKTERSEMDAHLLSLNFESFEKWNGKQFLTDVNINYELNQATVNTLEISDFAQILQDYDRTFTVSGNFSGVINDLNIKNFNFSYGENTILRSNFTLNGLPDFKNTFIFHEIDHFSTSLQDFESLNIEKFTNKNIQLPPQLNQLEELSYQGNFTGFIDDFVAYGNMYTNMGIISTDISIKPDKSKEIKFKGKLKTYDFDIGSLISPENHTVFNKLSMNINVNGYTLSGKKMHAVMDGMIQSIDLNNYTYKNVSIDGVLTEKTYDGALKINDPNITLNFLGKFNFEKVQPEFDFIVNVNDAKINKLNLVKDIDSTTNVNFDLTAKFIGDNLDSINGNVMLTNIDISNEKRNLHLNSFTIRANTVSETEEISFISDYADGKLLGNYDYESLMTSIKSSIYKHLPAISQNKNDPIKDNNLNNFKYNVHIKNSKILTFFLPDYKLANNTHIAGYFNPENEHITLNINTHKLHYKEQVLDNFILITETDTNSINIDLKTNYWKINDKIVMDSFSISATAKNNKIQFQTNWMNKDTSLYNGNIKAAASFRKPSGRKNPIIHLNVEPSYVTYNDTTWSINQSNLVIDSTMIDVSNLIINNNEQKYIVDGVISENEKDQLSLFFENLKLSNFNVFTMKAGLKNKGILNGKAVLSGIYKDLNFFTNLYIDTLIVNDEILGETNLKTNWINSKKIINIDVSSRRRKLKTLDIQGGYNPKSKEIDLAIKLNKLRMDILNPFLENTLSDIKGIASGKVSLTGKTKEPDLNGSLNVQKSSFTIDYLKTRYSFTHNLAIEHNHIIFNDLQLFDMYGNITAVNGSIRLLGKPVVDLMLDANQSFLMNTEEIDNDDFYGEAFLSGIINFKNREKRLTIDASGKTADNTKIFIPVSAGKDINQNDYINYINTDIPAQDIAEDQEEYKVDLSGIFMDFDLEVNPEASVQLILDEQTGEIIKASGNGNINMAITSNGKFEMIGNYTIEKGDYLFTLQNIISKKFSIEQGSSIKWTGDPYNADINIKAVYKTKAALGDLFGDTTSAYSKRVPVECQILLTEKLISPDISLAINLPTVSPETQSRVKSLLNTENKVSKQFLSLLVINKFLPDQDLVGGKPWMNAGSNYAFGASGAGVTASEFLSNQLSHMLSQISDDFDIGVNYRPGNELTTDEVEVAMSTQFLNDRVSVSGNLDMGGKRPATTNNNNTNTSNIVGDFKVEVKLNKSGKLRLKAFNKTTDELIYEDAPYKQGVGIMIREDFNSFGSLFTGYWKKIFNKKKKKE